FDLEQGQVIEECYPPDCLTQEEELEVAFKLFPDSVSQNHNRSSIHDCIFFFKFRRQSPTVSENVSSTEIVELDSEGRSQGSTGARIERKQRHDERLKRGGEQKSVVILSHSPYSNVFRPLLQNMGPLFFDKGKKALEHIAAYVSLWPVPAPGKQMELPISTATFKVYLPPAHSLPLNGDFMLEESASSMAPFFLTNQSVPRGLFHDADLFGIFRGLLLQLWLLWELLGIGEPILIIAPTPPQCCEAVAGLSTEAVWTSYAAVTKPDTSILNRLIDVGMSPRVEESMSVVNNEILRRHFLELTANFLAPFGPYFKTTTPSEGSSPFVEPPPHPSFNVEDFLSSLSARGAGKFLSKRKSENFKPWFQRRRAVAVQEQNRLWRLAKMKTDIKRFTSKMPELEIVDAFHAIERHLLEEI
ncbi:DENND6A-like protein, partial [Drosera capensis]